MRSGRWASGKLHRGWESAAAPPGASPLDARAVPCPLVGSFPQLSCRGSSIPISPLSKTEVPSTLHSLPGLGGSGFVSSQPAAQKFASRHIQQTLGHDVVVTPLLPFPTVPVSPPKVAGCRWAPQAEGFCGSPHALNVEGGSLQSQPGPPSLKHVECGGWQRETQGVSGGRYLPASLNQVLSTVSLSQGESL